MSNQETLRRARRQKEKARGTSPTCKAYGHMWGQDAYGTAQLPPGMVMLKCKNCPREKVARVQRTL